MRGLMRGLMHTDDPTLQTHVFSMTLPTPVCLAAGFDKNAEGFDALGALGFGCIEVGTLTGEAQPGNPKPRLFRLVRDEALVNRLGFNNRGSADAVERLQAPRHTVVGVNIGKTKAVPASQAASDYVASARRVAPFADYVAVNVSSPNTPGLRDLQAVEQLEPLLSAVRRALDETVPDRHVPLLVKIAPDLCDEDIDAVCDLALKLKLDGLIATNTTIARVGLRTDDATVSAFGAGGLSGSPLADRALEVLRRVRRRVGDRLVLVSVGGVSTADQAWERIVAGATLVQVYTGFVYQGPTFARQLSKGLAERARQAGFERVQDAVGSQAPPA